MSTFTNVAGLQVTNGTVNASNHVDFIIDFEQGNLDDDGVIALFQYLIDTGLAWSLQGFYGRTAKALIEAGHCFRADDLNRPGIIDLDGTEGQDRDNYTDDQDREFYTVDEEWEEE